VSEMNLKRLVWLDLETTGLDPFAPGAAILEIAIVITDCVFQQMAEPFHFCLKPSVDLLNLGPGVFDTHAKSGLFTDCSIVDPDTNSVENVDEWARNYIENQRATGSPLCGASVHFDRAWLRQHMPSVIGKLHYRNFDVSTFKILAELRGIELPPKREVHRAIPDLEDAIALAKIAAGWVRP
jgi:oligoribonuclease